MALVLGPGDALFFRATLALSFGLPSAPVIALAQVAKHGRPSLRVASTPRVLAWVTHELRNRQKYVRSSRRGGAILSSLSAR